jgi:hypothetical protein
MCRLDAGEAGATAAQTVTDAVPWGSWLRRDRSMAVGTPFVAGDAVRLVVARQGRAS